MQITARNMKRDELFWSNNEAKGLPLYSGRLQKKRARIATHHPIKYYTRRFIHRRISAHKKLNNYSHNNHRRESSSHIRTI